MVAVDDFGAGHSNFERIWRLEPDIVKLDRKMIADTAHREVIRRSLPRLVSLLHEAGCMVLAEGIETEEEALLMLDANVDMAQGYLFARPFPINNPKPMDLPTLRSVHSRFIDYNAEKHKLTQRDLAPYIQAFEQVANMIFSGAEIHTAAHRLFKLERSVRFYMLDERGNQAMHNINRDDTVDGNDPRLRPLLAAKGASWYHRPYFRRALEHHGAIQITEPYLSIPDARLCYTLSLYIKLDGEPRVLCLDVDVPS